MKSGHIIALVWLIMVSGCDVHYSGHRAISSPDGLNVIDLVTETNASNDPDPFQQHISIRAAENSRPIFSGNVFTCSCYEQPKITWLDNSRVEVLISGTVGQSFTPPAKVITAKNVTFFVEVGPFSQNDP